MMDGGSGIGGGCFNWRAICGGIGHIATNQLDSRIQASSNR